METQSEINAHTQADNVEENVINSKCNKKDTIMAIKWILILLLVLSYFIYQQIRYLDTTINRREFVNKISVDEMPKPFVFFKYEKKYNCELKAMNSSAVLSGADFIDLLSEPTVHHTLSDFEDISLEQILSNVTNHHHILITDSISFHASNYRFNWTGFLWIPSNDAAQHTEVGTLMTFFDTLTFVLLCPTTSSSGTTASNMVNDWHTLGLGSSINIVNNAGIIYYKLDHKEVLYKYNSLEEIMNGFASQTESMSPIAPGGVGLVSYEWLVVDNKIANEQSNRFRETSVQYYEIGDSLLMFGLSSVFSFIPIVSGDKTITTITKRFSIWDVIAGAGGIFSVVSSFLGIAFMYLIWGVGKFNGIASESYPSSIERRKMKPFIDKCVDDRNDQYEQKIVNLQQEIVNMQQEIVNMQQEYKTEIANLKQFIQENRL
eukprot:68905_1